MKFSLKDENHNLFEYDLLAAEKIEVLYDLVRADLNEFYVEGFYLYSPDLEVKINTEYPLYKYFGTCEDISVELEVKSFQKIEDSDNDEMSQCESIETETETESEILENTVLEEIREEVREIYWYFTDVKNVYEKNINFLQIIIVFLSFALLIK